MCKKLSGNKQTTNKTQNYFSKEFLNLIKIEYTLKIS